jgi:hypothetical protein
LLQLENTRHLIVKGCMIRRNKELAPTWAGTKRRARLVPRGLRFAASIVRGVSRAARLPAGKRAHRNSLLEIETLTRWMSLSIRAQYLMPFCHLSQDRKRNARLELIQPFLREEEEPTMASKHFTETPTADKAAAKQDKLPKTNYKSEADAKLHNKMEHKDHPFETFKQPFPFFVEDLTATAGAAQPAYGVGQGGFVPKPQKETFKEFQKEYFLEKVLVKEHIKEIAKEYEGKLYGGPLDVGGPVEQRLQALESVVTQMSHFISQELRPDLSQGALKQEPDVATATRARKAKKAAAKLPKARK